MTILSIAALPDIRWAKELKAAMSEIGGEIVIILLLIVANGVFAMSEMAVITARKSRLQDWVKSGNRSAKVALELALGAQSIFLRSAGWYHFGRNSGGRVCRGRRCQLDGRLHRADPGHRCLQSGNRFGARRSDYYLLFARHR